MSDEPLKLDRNDHPLMTDGAALDYIQLLLSGKTWEVDNLEQIASYVRMTDRDVHTPTEWLVTLSTHFVVEGHDATQARNEAMDMARDIRLHDYQTTVNRYDDDLIIHGCPNCGGHEQEDT